ncbi:hypothetical protein D3C72_1142230 [compost metagenome]
MERPTCPVSAGSNAIFFSFRHVLPAQLLQPSRRLGSLFEVKTTGVEDFIQGDFAHRHRNDFRPGIEPLEDDDQFLTLVAADQVDLAEQNHIGELDLLNQQIGNRTFVFFAKCFSPGGQAFGSLIIEQEVHTVDHRDHGVETRDVVEALAVFIAKGEGFRHRQRFGNAGGFDQQIVEAALPGELAHFLEQVFT